MRGELVIGGGEGEAKPYAAIDMQEKSNRGRESWRPATALGPGSATLAGWDE